MVWWWLTIIDLIKKSTKQFLIIKVDFEKACDFDNWSFLDYMIRRFGFGRRWHSLIWGYAFSRNLHVLVNRCPTKKVNIHKGLQKREPLDPFIFLPCVVCNLDFQWALLSWPPSTFSMHIIPFPLVKKMWIIFGILKQFVDSSNSPQSFLLNLKTIVLWVSASIYLSQG